MLLGNLALFLRIVEKGGLAAAGREVGLSPATVSERLTALERHYGAALLTRTTRAISLTTRGARWWTVRGACWPRPTNSKAGCGWACGRCRGRCG